MEVKFNTNSYAKPSFGMAQLTRQGTEVAKQFLGELPKYADDAVFAIKNKTPKMLKRVADEEVKDATRMIGDFFQSGAGEYKINNQMFVENQILPMRSYNAIKKFLSAQCKEARPKKASPDDMSQTTIGKAVVGNLVEIFDKNITNERLSRKQCQKILKLAEPYMDAVDVSPRVTAVSGKIYSK